MPYLLLLVALLGASEWTFAQSRARPDPADPSAATSPPQYQPAFSDYRPFQDEPVRSWKEVNKEVADNPGMGAMKHGPGMTMPGMESKPGDAAKAKGGTGGHDMGSMQQKPGASKSGMESKTGDAVKGKGGAAGHDMGSMQQKPGASKSGVDSKTDDTAEGKGGASGHDMGAMHHKPGSAMPGIDKPAATAPKSKDGHDMTAMAKPHSAPGRPEAAATAGIAATGVVQSVDKANGKVRLTHDPIAAMGWPKMTMFFRLKERSLADQVKAGDKVDFTLEKSASGYVVAGFRKSNTEANPAVEAPKPAGHGKH